mmetsp:Transcript_14702/g.44093  ORF Transcript_14702/g.44093 Transcript_14702/m.44093 type:complete len:503 (-) Transcript_14702:205-1713(-)
MPLGLHRGVAGLQVREEVRLHGHDRGRAPRAQVRGVRVSERAHDPVLLGAVVHGRHPGLPRGRRERRVPLLRRGAVGERHLSAAPAPAADQHDRDVHHGGAGDHDRGGLDDALRDVRRPAGGLRAAVLHSGRLHGARGAPDDGERERDPRAQLHGLMRDGVAGVPGRVGGAGRRLRGGRGAELRQPPAGGLCPHLRVPAGAHDHHDHDHGQPARVHDPEHRAKRHLPPGPRGGPGRPRGADVDLRRRAGPAVGARSGNRPGQERGRTLPGRPGRRQGGRAPPHAGLRRGELAPAVGLRRDRRPDPERRATRHLRRRLAAERPRRQGPHVALRPPEPEPVVGAAARQRDGGVPPRAPRPEGRGRPLPRGARRRGARQGGRDARLQPVRERRAVVLRRLLRAGPEPPGPLPGLPPEGEEQRQGARVVVRHGQSEPAVGLQRHHGRAQEPPRGLPGRLGEEDGRRQGPHVGVHPRPLEPAVALHRAGRDAPPRRARRDRGRCRGR